MRLRRVRTDGTVVDTIALPSCAQRAPPAKFRFTGSDPGGMMMRIPFLAATLWVPDGRGGAWCSPNDEYVLVHRRLGSADTLNAVRRPYTRLPVSSAERDSAEARARKTLAKYRVVDADYSLIPKVHPIFSRLNHDDKGNVWARLVTPTGSESRFDVYDSNGRQVATVTTRVPFRPAFPIHVRGDHVYGVALDEDDVQHVVRARIVRGPR
jgi:hypothetical protein